MDAVSPVAVSVLAPRLGTRLPKDTDPVPSFRSDALGSVALVDTYQYSVPPAVSVVQPIRAVVSAGTAVGVDSIAGIYLPTITGQKVYKAALIINITNMIFSVSIQVLLSAVS